MRKDRNNKEKEPYTEKLSKLVYYILLGFGITFVIVVGFCLVSEFIEHPPQPSIYRFNISTEKDTVYLNIENIREKESNLLEVTLCGKDYWEKGWTAYEKEKKGESDADISTWNSIWSDAQKIEVKNEKTLALKSEYKIGDFSKEYVVAVKNSIDEVIFNKTVVLKPRSIKFGEGVVAKDIKVTPISANYTKKTDYGREAGEGKIFFEVKFEAENIGNYKSLVSLSHERLKTDRGYLYDSLLTCYFAFPIQPGEKDYCHLVFEIPEDQKATKIYFALTEGGFEVYEERILQLQ